MYWGPMSRRALVSGFTLAAVQAACAANLPDNAAEEFADAAAPGVDRSSEPFGEPGVPDAQVASFDGAAPAAALLLPPTPKVVPVILLEATGLVGDGGIVDEPKVPGRFRLIAEHDEKWKTAEDVARLPVAIDTRMGIEHRGNSSVTFSKKSFSIELRDGVDMAVQLPVLGMPREADWVLYACYLDRTCLRTALAYTLARQMGAGWQPRFQFVEVFLNGSYIGLYNIVERIKRDRYRLDVPEPAATSAAGDLTGGYIVRLEADGKGGGRDFQPAGADRPWTYDLPRHDLITAEQKTYLSNFIGRFE